MSDYSTGWQKPQLVTDAEGPKGVIQTSSGLESKPCMLCKSFAKDTRKLVQHFEARGLVPDTDGFYETPIAKSVKGRTSMRVHPRDYGFCNRNCYVTHMNGTCEDFAVTQTREELALKIKERR
jgi:hypothetical protein